MQRSDDRGHARGLFALRHARLAKHVLAGVCGSTAVVTPTVSNATPAGNATACQTSLLLHVTDNAGLGASKKIMFTVLR